MSGDPRGALKPHGHEPYGGRREWRAARPKLTFLDREFARPLWKRVLMNVQPSELKVRSQDKQLQAEAAKHVNGQAIERSLNLQPSSDGETPC